jgi:hypothetical protein
VYLTKRMTTQVLIVNSGDEELRETAQTALDDADAIDAAEQQNGEVDEARVIHERRGARWLDAREGPAQCACGERIDVVDLLGRMVRHFDECHHA